MTSLPLSVVVCTHDPQLDRLHRVLRGLRDQTLPPASWELVIVDNAGTDRAALERIDMSWHRFARIVREEMLGLTSARLRGFAEARGDVLVLVDDDNVLAPDYLAIVAEAFAGDPRLGAAGGRSVPEFEAPPPPWTRDLHGMLAIRDLGDVPLRANWREPGGRSYPPCSPIGAGMAVRRCGAEAYAAAVRADPRRRSLDRSGSRLVSGGDNDLVMSVLEAGLDVAYLPRLSLIHLIPSTRLGRAYLGALNRAMTRSWLRVLALHGIRTWPAIPRASLPARKLRAWVRAKAWRGPAEWVLWQGQCGHFEGQADLRDP